MQKPKTLVIANWKMNPATLADAKKLFSDTKKVASGARGVQVIVCPPAPFLSELKRSYSGKSIAFGAQDVFWGTIGAHTGSASAPMLKSVGASHVIVGHSERRALGETNDDVARKVSAAMGEGLTVILCVGERERDTHGEYLGFIQKELEAVLQKLQKQDLKRLVIAYEPIWAVGKTDEDSLDPHGMHEMSLYIRKLLVERYGSGLAKSVPIIYGGSVERENSEALLEEGDIDGFLIGHASLDPREFGDILKNSSKR